MPTNLTGTTVIYLQTFQGPPGEPGDAGVSTEQVQDIVNGLLTSNEDHLLLTYSDVANELLIDFADPLDFRDIQYFWVGNARFYGPDPVQFDWGIQLGQELRINNGQDITVGTVSGSRFGHTNLEKIAFWGATPRIRPTGWTTVPTGTLTRTTFVSDSVTLPQLAARVAALIVDLHSAAGSGLVGP